MKIILTLLEERELKEMARFKALHFIAKPTAEQADKRSALALQVEKTRDMIALIKVRRDSVGPYAPLVEEHVAERRVHQPALPKSAFTLRQKSKKALSTAASPYAPLDETEAEDCSEWSSYLGQEAFVPDPFIYYKGSLADGPSMEEICQAAGHKGYVIGWERRAERRTRRIEKNWEASKARKASRKPKM